MIIKNLKKEIYMQNYRILFLPRITQLVKNKWNLFSHKLCQNIVKELYYHQIGRYLNLVSIFLWKVCIRLLLTFSLSLPSSVHVSLSIL